MHAVIVVKLTIRSLPDAFAPVQSRFSWGWTINFGHSAGPWILLGFIIGIPLIQAGALAITGYYAEGCKDPAKKA